MKIWAFIVILLLVFTMAAITGCSSEDGEDSGCGCLEDCEEDEDAESSEEKLKRETG